MRRGSGQQSHFTRATTIATIEASPEVMKAQYVQEMIEIPASIEKLDDSSVQIVAKETSHFIIRHTDSKLRKEYRADVKYEAPKLPYITLNAEAIQKWREDLLHQRIQVMEQLNYNTHVMDELGEDTPLLYKENGNASPQYLDTCSEHTGEAHLALTDAKE